MRWVSRKSFSIYHSSSIALGVGVASLRRKTSPAFPHKAEEVGDLRSGTSTLPQSYKDPSFTTETFTIAVY